MNQDDRNLIQFLLSEQSLERQIFWMIGLSQNGAIIICSGLQNIAPCIKLLTAQNICFQKLLLIFLPILTIIFGPNWRKSTAEVTVPVTFSIDFSSILGQKALVLQSLLNHENFKESQNCLTSTNPKPPAFSESFAWSLETLSGLLPQRNLKNRFSSNLICFLSKLGKTKARWLNFERASVLIIVIFHILLIFYKSNS